MLRAIASTLLLLTHLIRRITARPAPPTEQPQRDPLPIGASVARIVRRSIVIRTSSRTAPLLSARTTHGPTDVFSVVQPTHVRGVSPMEGRVRCPALN